MSTVRTLLAGAVLAAAPAGALADGFDTGVGIVDNQFVTFEVVDTMDGEQLGDPELTFAAEWGELFPGFGDDPGFFGEAGTFEDGSSFRFDFPTGLKKWNMGSGAFDFATETVETTFGGESVVLPSGDEFGVGLEIGVGSAEFDEHPEWQLTPDDATGIYLIEMVLADPEGVIGTSGSFWSVVNYGMPEDLHDEVIAYVEENIAPAPGSLALLGLGGLVAARRRR